MTDQEKIQFIENIRQFAAEHGWEKFEEVLQTEADFKLIRIERETHRRYEHPDGSSIEITDIESEPVADLFEIINEQSEIFELLLARTLDDNPSHPESLAEILNAHHRVYDKFRRMAARLGWEPQGEAGSGEESTK